ncbi:hypothetical protein E5D57_006150 [Metarhizium anisopliae]|nr:hypothetical protein E5D57_006150 [Metarhizium anisopliae]
MASLALAGAIDERQNRPNPADADRGNMNDEGVVTKTNAARSATSLTQEEVEERVKEHCGRFGDDTDKKSVCKRSVRQCAGQVHRDSEIKEFLECIDNVQACFDFWPHESYKECYAKAQTCRKQHKLPLGELTKLTECLKIYYPPLKFWVDPSGESGKSAS